MAAQQSGVSRRRLIASAGATLGLAGAGALGRADPAVASTAGTATQVPFSSLPGATDDAKLTAFMAAASSSASGYHGQVLVLDELRTYAFTKQQTLYSGFAMVGAGRAVDQARASLPIPNKISLNISGGTGGGGWLALPNNSSVYGLFLGGLSFDGNSTSRVFDVNPTSVIWTSTLRDISAQNLAGVIGSSEVAQPTDFVCLDGFWNVNNVRDVGFNLAGSDNFVKPTGLNLDSPSALLPASKFLVRFTNLSKTEVQGLYVTADQHSAIDISGANSHMKISNCQLEGRNANTPCFGALVRIATSNVTIRDCWTSYAMSGGNNGRTDLGVLHVDSGTVLIDGCIYQRATGVAESVPYLYVGGGNVTVRNIQRSGTWAGLPVVRWLGGNLDADSSVTVVRT